MDPELEDIEDPLSRFPFQIGEGVQVPGIEDERFFADRIGSNAQGKTYMGVVQVVGRADAGVVDRLSPPWRRNFSACRSNRSNSVKKATS
jgi:hypothetical protein